MQVKHGPAAHSWATVVPSRSFRNASRRSEHKAATTDRGGGRGRGASNRPSYEAQVAPGARLVVLLLRLRLLKNISSNTVPPFSFKDARRKSRGGGQLEDRRHKRATDVFNQSKMLAVPGTVAAERRRQSRPPTTACRTFITASGLCPCQADSFQPRAECRPRSSYSELATRGLGPTEDRRSDVHGVCVRERATGKGTFNAASRRVPNEPRTAGKAARRKRDSSRNISHAGSRACFLVRVRRNSPSPP